uniref:Uncharacterized protein n=1 Tax=Panagrolaimus sp. JU765 TaxID=591449 RepID=A0AC34QCE2_9BILA
MRCFWMTADNWKTDEAKQKKVAVVKDGESSRNVEKKDETANVKNDGGPEVKVGKQPEEQIADVGPVRQDQQQPVPAPRSE